MQESVRGAMGETGLISGTGLRCLVTNVRRHDGATNVRGPTSYVKGHVATDVSIIPSPGYYLLSILKWKLFLKFLFINVLKYAVLTFKSLIYTFKLS